MVQSSNPKPIAPKKSSGTVAAIVVGSVLALAAGGVTTAWWINREQVSADQLPTGVQVLPQDVMMTFTVTTDELQWRQLRQFGTPETQAAFDRRLALWRDRLLVNNGLNFQQDIQPWVGDQIAIALLPIRPEDIRIEPADPKGNSAGGGNRLPPLIAVLPIADPVTAQTLLSQKQFGTGTPAERTHKGVTIRDGQTRNGQTISAAVLDNQWLVLSTRKTAIDQTIDAYQSGNTLIKTAGYQQAIAQLNAPTPFLHSYVNLPIAREVSAVNPFQTIPVQNLPPFQTHQGMAFNLALQPQGIQINGMGWLPDNSDRPANNEQIRQILEMLPSDTLTMAAGSNFETTWQQFSQQPTNPGNALNPSRIKEGIETLTQLSFDKDLLPWMKGEFALALIPGTETAGKQGVGLMFAVQTNDRRAAETALTKLDDIMVSRYRFNVNKNVVAGQPVVNWASPFGSLTVSRGWLENNVAFISVGSTALQNLIPRPTTPLLQNPGFQSAMANDLEPKQGYFFMDIDRLFDPQNSVPLPLLPKQQAAVVQAIRAIGLTTNPVNDSMTSYRINTLLRSTNTTRPLPAPGSSDPSTPDPLLNPAPPGSSLPPAIPAPSL